MKKAKKNNNSKRKGREKTKKKKKKMRIKKQMETQVAGNCLLRFSPKLTDK